ncbi:dihydroorotase [Sporomusa acidovorans]|uniref:Dihydroorotase n=1 Tax=Sporomusa acidovorans (strain ATCC 49682 / DSM 3132 / Mol) TaxID=1123286 RepID=A0ABZ3J657_SPOA4|nr:dihydroorotase [Sporomusa acidovorans]OZC15387.1 dihydroorotase [Sporomusa acidovorans DSM 3132]SDF13630.1 dihydroorotase [Sporomusa acidovorans]
MDENKIAQPAEVLLLKNGRIIDPSQGLDGPADVMISAGKIAAIAPNLSCEGAGIFDCSGKWIVPGLIDVHCHLREPGFEHKETIATGTRAAARGGFTTVIAMANLNPVPDKLSIYAKIQKLIEEKAVVRVVQAASVTKDLKGRDLCDMATLAAAGVTIFSDDGLYLDRAAVLYQALQLAKKLNVVISLHEEDATLKSYWPTAYEPVNEFAAIARDLEIVRVTGGKVHFQHLSTANSVELIRRAKKEGLNVTAEVCPHHLTLTVADVARQGTNAKMAPPVRTQEDIAELIRGLDDGTVDVIATDHAPHALDDKNVTFDLAANGIVGLETALPLLLDKLVHEQGLSPAWLIQRMSCNPAKLFGLPGGTLQAGAPADVCVIDPFQEWMIDKNAFLSKSRNTPYHGTRVKGNIWLTFVNGNVVFDGRETAQEEHFVK